MTDVTMLGIIAAGLGLYCLHLQWKVRFIMRATQAVLGGVHDGIVKIEERDGVYYPTMK
jgi:hypothetical protein